MAALWLSIVVGLSMSTTLATQFFPDHGTMSIIGLISLLFVVGLPILWVVLTIIRLVFGRSIGRPWSIGLGVLWSISFFSFISIGGRLSQEFAQEEQVEKSLNMGDFSSDTLTLAFLPPREDDRRYVGDVRIEMHELEELLGVDVSYHLVPSADAQWHLSQTTTARGYRKADAQQLAAALVVPLQWEGNKVTAPQEIAFQDVSKWRNQRTTLAVQVPVGKYIRFSDDAVSNHTRGKMDSRNNGRLYRMSAGGTLICQDCAATNSKSDDLQGLQYKDFNTIQLSGPMKVTIAQGDRYEVLLTGDEQHLSQATTTQDGERLTVNLKADRLDSSVRLYITLPSLATLQIENTDDVWVKGFERDDMAITAAGDFEMKTDVKVKTLRLTGDSGVTFEFTGSADELTATLSDQSRLDTDRGQVAKARLVAKGDSRIKISKNTTLLEQDIAEDSILRLFE